MKKMIFTAGTLSVLILLLMAIAPCNGAVTHSTTANVTVGEYINFTIAVNGSGVNFGDVNPGTANNSAANNPAVELIVGSDTNANVSVSLKGDDFEAFGVSNVTYDDDATLGESSETNLTQNTLQTSYVGWWTANNKDVEQRKSIYYWITIPESVSSGSYQSTFYYQCEAI